MNEKYKVWLKKIGIVGFIFFLLKGILWLVFGTAIYKWLKSLIIFGLASSIPFILTGQSNSFTQSEFKNYFHFADQFNNPKLCLTEFKAKPFFCRLEDQLNENKKAIIKFRLGSVEYSNQLEYSQFLLRNDYGNQFLR